MKASATSNGFTVRLIAGTHTILIALDLSVERRQGCLGFSIQRTALDASGTGTPNAQLDTVWLQRRIAGQSVSMEKIPLQEFRWEDAGVSPASKYRYKVYARYTPNSVTPSDPVVQIDIATEDPRNPETAVFFNRGAAGKSAFEARFGTNDLDKVAPDQANQAREWLSNGLEEGLNAFLAQAEGTGSGLHAAVYEIQKSGPLAGLKAALDRGVEVKILYHRRHNSDKDSLFKNNEAAIAEAGLAASGIPRASNPQTVLMHNKFVVRLKNGRPEAVWTGSTNWTDIAFYGQLNYGQAIYDPEIAGKYEQYFQLLASDPPANQMKRETAVLSPAPNPIPKGMYPIFSPQADEKILDAYSIIANQSQLLLACNPFDPAPQLLQAFEDKVSNPGTVFFYLTGSSKSDMAQKLSETPQGYDAITRASATIKRVGIPIGARILACDPLGTDPLLIIGSSGFSRSATILNDENSLLIRGNIPLADIYFTEIMFAFDQSIRETSVETADWNGLASDDSWSTPYYDPGSKKALIRHLFADTRAEVTTTAAAESAASKASAAVQPAVESKEASPVEQPGGEKTNQAVPRAAADFLPLASFSADSVKGNDDLIGIENDVEAFAALIASRSLAPPLSIGLFGEWGSGKTFFMNKLKDAVDNLSLKMQATKKMQHELPFYKHIVQIEFNAWHYMEGNIWASIAEHIIKNLAVRGKEQTPNEAMIELLQNNLELRQKARQAAEQDVATAQVNTRQAAKEFEDASLEYEHKKKELETLTTFLVARNFLLEKLKPAFEILSKNLNLGVEIETGQDFEKALGNAHQVVDQAVPVITPLLHAKDRVKRWLLLLLILAGAPLLVWLVGFVFSQLGQAWLGQVIRWIAGAGMLLASAASWLRQQASWLTEQTQRVKEIQGEYDRRLQEGEKETRDKIQILKTELGVRNERLLKAINVKNEAVEREKEARKQLDQATPANLLAGWLHDRAKNDDYSKHLGLLAIIRQDFDTLSNMMELINWRLAAPAPDDSEKLKNPNFKPKYLNYADEEKEKDTQVSRIVLYIDDLDRCPPEKVVDVLQAVHLLLAFPLFVVVVGVDARWIKQSLKARYRQMLHMDGQGEIEDPEEVYFGKATPDDYLEKIFQIPFWLKPMDEADSWRFIHGLLTPPAAQKNKSVETKGLDAAALAGENAGDSLENEAALAEGEKPGEKTAVAASGGEKSVPGQASLPSNGQDQIETMPTGSGTVEKSVPAVESTEQSQVNESTAPIDDTPSAADEGATSAELAARSLEITPEELKFIEKLAPLLGRSPRSIKRFANVYRLIKAALEKGTLNLFLNLDENGNPRLSNGNGSNPPPDPKPNSPRAILDYQAVLFLLVVDTGLPDLAGDFFAALEHEDFHQVLANSPTHGGTPLQSQLDWLADKLKLKTPDDEQGELAEQRIKLRDWLAKNGPKTEGSFLYGVQDLESLAYWARRVARFSFQVYGPETLTQPTTTKKPDRKKTKTARGTAA